MPILRDSATLSYSPAPVSNMMRVSNGKSGTSFREIPETSTAKLAYTIPDVLPNSCRTTVMPVWASFSLTAMGYSVTSRFKSLNSKLGMVARSSGESSVAWSFFNSTVLSMMDWRSSSVSDSLILARRSFSSYDGIFVVLDISTVETTRK